MLVIFKSKAAGEIIMYEENARPILDLLGRDTRRGIILAAETGDAIVKLEEEMARRKVIEAEERAKREAQAREAEERDGKRPEIVEPVSFTARVYPFLEMLKRTQKMEKDIVWGV